MISITIRLFCCAIAFGLALVCTSAIEAFLIGIGMGCISAALDGMFGDENG